MFLPWDYALDADDPTGSMAKLATAIKELRDENTLLIDAGDTIQDNMADLFLADEVHPMIACMNALGYDVGVTGNHEYNYGMDIVRKTVASFNGEVITGNVKDENGSPVADAYTILEKAGGVRVGLIGMVTPLIQRWDKVYLEGCTVSDPVAETRAIVDQIRDDVDVLIGVMHMGLENEYDLPNTGVRDLARKCPEFDLIIAAHRHQLVEDEEVNGVMVVENKNHAQTMACVDLTLEPDGGGWKVVGRASSPVEVAGYEPDPEIVGLMAPYDERAKKYAHETIGILEGGPLVEKSEFEAIPQAVLADSALADLIHTVQLHYTGANVSATALPTPDASVEPGPIRRCDVSQIYKYANTLYTLEMTGAQLKKHLEWSACFFKTFRPGDLTLSFDPEVPLYCFDTFEGVNYQINVSKEPWERIEGLSWPDGTPVADNDVFVITVNNYRATTQLLVPDVLFPGDDIPKLLETDVQGSVGGVRELIADYIQNVEGGSISPECDDSWGIVGIDWDEELHQRAVELVEDGVLTLSRDDKHLPAVAITEDDVRNAWGEQGIKQES
jgi:2',3'-cyclic-nucleotide 2'-phosphodiesterase/3'-nucleotidase